MSTRMVSSNKIVPHLFCRDQATRRLLHGPAGKKRRLAGAPTVEDHRTPFLPQTNVCPQIPPPTKARAPNAGNSGRWTNPSVIQQDIRPLHCQDTISSGRESRYNPLYAMCPTPSSSSRPYTVPPTYGRAMLSGQCILAHRSTSTFLSRRPSQHHQTVLARRTALL